MSNFNQMIRIADIHAERIRLAIDNTRHLFPIDETTVIKMRADDLAWTELLLSRFGKLQDFIGAKIIDAFFEINFENTSNLTILDKVHRLEKLEILEAQTWKDMRETRNHIAHEYPDQPELTARYLNQIYELAPMLLTILDNIKNYVEKSYEN